MVIFKKNTYILYNIIYKTINTEKFGYMAIARETRNLLLIEYQNGVNQKTIIGILLDNNKIRYL